MFEYDVPQMKPIAMDAQRTTSTAEHDRRSNRTPLPAMMPPATTAPRDLPLQDRRRVHRPPLIETRLTEPPARHHDESVHGFAARRQRNLLGHELQFQHQRPRALLAPPAQRRAISAGHCASATSESDLTQTLDLANDPDKFFLVCTRSTIRPRCRNGAARSAKGTGSAGQADRTT